MNWKDLKRKSYSLTAPLVLAAAMVGTPRPLIAQQDQQPPAATQKGAQQPPPATQPDQQQQLAPTKKSGLFNKLKNAAQTAGRFREYLHFGSRSSPWTIYQFNAGSWRQGTNWQRWTKCPTNTKRTLK